MAERAKVGRALTVTQFDAVAAPDRVAADGAMHATAAASGPALHLYRFRPAVLIGRHQWSEVEVRIDWCRAHGIAIARRVTGGGAMYVDGDQIGFTHAMPRRWDTLTGSLARGAAAIKRALAQFGITCVFKAPNDLEVGGRKLASVFAIADESTFLIQGIVLLDADIGRMLHALKVPTEKLSPDGLAGARQRLVTLRELLGAPADRAEVGRAIIAGMIEAFEIENVVAGIASTAESAATASGFEACPSDASGYDEAFWPCGSGAVRARLWIDGATDTVTRAALACDGFIAPPEVLGRLAAAITDARPSDIRSRVGAFFAAEPAELVGFGPADLARVLAMAADRPAQRRSLALAQEEANALMVHDEDGRAPGAIAAEATVMLVPYCAKLVDCKWRQQDGCTRCGLCEVGDAYRLAETRGLRVISIHNYEHLCVTLAQLKAERVPAYVGMCCSQFYLKRHRAFVESGIPAVLMNIGGANCYELRAEEQAYAGAFAAKSALNVALLRKVLRVPDDDPSPETR